MNVYESEGGSAHSCKPWPGGTAVGFSPVGRRRGPQMLNELLLEAPRRFTGSPDPSALRHLAWGIVGRPPGKAKRERHAVGGVARCGDEKHRVRDPTASGVAGARQARDEIIPGDVVRGPQHTRRVGRGEVERICPQVPAQRLEDRAAPQAREEDGACRQRTR